MARPAATTKKPSTRKPAAPRKRVQRTVPTPTTVDAKPAARQVKHGNFIFAVGRRKEAVARVRWHKEGAGEIMVNDKPIERYFATNELQGLVRDPLVVTQNDKVGMVTAKVMGGGSQGQAEAVRLGISRALVKMDADLRLVLKRAGYLRRDPRVKERKKYGLKRARRAPQWQKR